MYIVLDDYTMKLNISRNSLMTYIVVNDLNEHKIKPTKADLIEILKEKCDIDQKEVVKAILYLVREHLLEEAFETIGNQVINHYVVDRVKDVEPDKEPRTVNRFTPPSYVEVREFAEKRCRLDLAADFFAYYNASEWKDKNNHKIRNWKQKFISWENRQYDGFNNDKRQISKIILD